MRPALRDGADVWSYGQLLTAIARCSDDLRTAGVAPGDRVMLSGPNGPAIAVGYFAIHAVGGIAVPVAPETPVEGLLDVAAMCRPVLALTADVVQSVRVVQSDMHVSDGKPSHLDLPGTACLALATWAKLPEVAASPANLRMDCAPGQAADLLFTTGTTGRKKGVLLNHSNILAAAQNINTFIGARSDDLEVVPIPLSHSFGLGRLRCMALVGHCLALEPGMRNPAVLFKRIKALRATGLAMVPAGFALLRRFIKRHLADLAPHLRYIEIGSAPLAADDRAWLIEHLPNTRLCHHYGLTEASRAAFSELHRDAGRPGTVGTASPNVQIRAVAEDGQEVAAGEWGELQVRGGMVMAGYFEQPERTAQVLNNGWLSTGDTGAIDAGGYIRLQGRRSDVINVGGLKVAPEEVEARLQAYPGIEEAACTGVPDPAGVSGQRVAAFVVVTHGAEPLDETALVSFLRQTLEEFALPIRFVPIDALPRTASGKIMRHQLPATD